MKKYSAILLILVLIFSFSSCSNPGPTPSENINWTQYNEQAEEFVTALANSDFDAAFDMLDATMKQGLPVSVLESEVWNRILSQAGAFISIHEISNLFIDGSYVCLTTSQHERSGVTLRVVFNEDVQIAGLYIHGFPPIPAE